MTRRGIGVAIGPVLPRALPAALFVLLVNAPNAFAPAGGGTSGFGGGGGGYSGGGGGGYGGGGLATAAGPATWATPVSAS